jgi:hypothetical protein
VAGDRFPVLRTYRLFCGCSDSGTADADPDAMANSHHSFMRAMAEPMQADHDAAQGPDHWQKNPAGVSSGEFAVLLNTAFGITPAAARASSFSAGSKARAERSA